MKQSYHPRYGQYSFLQYVFPLEILLSPLRVSKRFQEGQELKKTSVLTKAVIGLRRRKLTTREDGFWEKMYLISPFVDLQFPHHSTQALWRPGVGITAVPTLLAVGN